MNSAPPTTKATRLADIVVGQEADTAWFLSRVPGGPSFALSNTTRYEGQDEDGNPQKWAQGMNCWKREA